MAYWDKLILGVFEPTMDIFKEPQKPTPKPIIKEQQK